MRALICMGKDRYLITYMGSPAPSAEAWKSLLADILEVLKKGGCVVLPPNYVLEVLK